ncbi:unnamed protein product [Gordionus sp. m RMFG-2023]|uniref:pre-mRNA-processing factor 39-like n=1 Tax=Gordionus sp. m RMFG-2023 TaxID=3053472 RepID=UPI0030E51BE2
MATNDIHNDYYEGDEFEEIDQTLEQHFIESQKLENNDNLNDLPSCKRLRLEAVIIQNKVDKYHIKDNLDIEIKEDITLNHIKAEMNQILTYDNAQNNTNIHSALDDHYSSQIKSIGEDPVYFDIITMIENIPHNNRKYIEDQLMDILSFTKNCFSETLQSWYENFDLLQKQHDEILKNITDFNAWVTLLQYCESLLRNPQVIKEEKQQMALEVLRHSFKEFLKRYPYCYGYWKNYADIERKFGLLDNVFKIYDKALKAFPNSVDLWIFYINFIIENSASENSNPFISTLVITEHQWSDEQIRKLFEKAIQKVGSDYKSEPFWDLYLTWEMKHGEMRKVTKVFDLALKEMTAAYRQFFERFKNHIETNDIQEIITEEELDRIKRDLNLFNPKHRHSTEELTDDQIIAIRDKIIETRQEIVAETEMEVKKRKTYEDNIKRPYFHIKPLERFQLKNWNQYLDYEMNITVDLDKGEKTGLAKNTRVKSLFERCLVTCALYEEFWLKYAKYMETLDLNAMRRVFQRACFIHLPTKPNIFLAWAAVEEKYGNFHCASFILNLLDKNVPDLVQLTMRRINLYRRRGDMEDLVERLYRENLTKYESNLCYYSYFVIQYARYIHRVKNDKPQALKLLEDAIINDPHNEKLYLQLLDMEYQTEPLNIDRIAAIFDRTLNSTLPDSSKTAFAQRKYEFLESLDHDVYRINKARDDFISLLKIQLGGDFSSTYQKSYVKGNVPLLPPSVASANLASKSSRNTASPRASSSSTSTAVNTVSNAAIATSDYYSAYYQQWASAYHQHPGVYTPAPTNPMYIGGNAYPAAYASMGYPSVVPLSAIIKK